MIELNNKIKIQTYFLDTKKTLVERISASLNSILQYIYILTEIKDTEINRIKKIKASNLLDSVKDDKNNLDYFSFYEKNKDFYPQISAEEMLKLWLSYKDNLNKDYLEVIKTNVTENFKNIYLDFDDIVKNRKIFLKTIQTDIENFKIKQKEDDAILEKFNTESKIKYSDFELFSTTFEINLNTTFNSLYNVFDNIMLNDKVVFASYNNFFKVHKNFIPSVLWAISENDKILLRLKTLKKKLIPTKEEDYEENYSIVTLYIDEVTKILKIELTSILSKKYFSKEESINHVLSIFNKENISNIQKETQKKIGGVFYIPKHSFNKYIYSDLSMNDKIFSFMKINDNRKTKGAKQGTFIKFMNPLNSEGNMIAVVTENIVDIINPLKDLLSQGDSYIRIKISKARSKEDIEIFQRIFLKLLEVYDEKYVDLVDFYREFIPQFEKIKSKVVSVKEVVKVKELRKKASDLFLPGYSRYCPNIPSIYEEGEIKDTNLQIMKFPKTPEEGKQYYYVCDTSEKYPYPGLRINKSKSKDIYKFIPCCYTKDQSIKKKSGFLEYYKDMKEEEIGKKYIFTTSKILPYNSYGELPENLNNLFDSLDSSNKYLRKGMHSTPSSFLECILEAVKGPVKIEKIRSELISKANVAVCKQEMYDFSIENIISILKDEKEYLNPKYFLRFLEVIYDCKIYLFENDELVTPNYTENYLRYISNKKMIFIYINNFYKDDAVYCELIVAKNDLEIKTFFNENSKVGKEIENIYSGLLNSLSLNKPSKKIFISEALLKDIISQDIDEKGKCRSMTTKDISFVVSPLPPLNKNFNKVKIKDLKSSLLNVLTFIEKHKLNISYKVTLNDIPTEIKAEKDGIKFFFAINEKEELIDDKKLDNIIASDIINIPTEKSLLDISYKNYKISKYITEYIFYLFSYFISENNIKDLDDEAIIKFINKHTKIDTSYVYKKVKENFSLNDNGIMKNKIIIFTSEELLKRFVYFLRLSIFNAKEEIINYKNFKVLKMYYENIRDFKSSENFVIIKTIKLFEKYIKIKQNEIKNLTDTILEQESPYFFKNLKIRNKVSLSQYNENINKAKQVCYAWNNSKYNIGYIKEDFSDEINLDYNLYFYKDKNNIKKYRVGKESDNRIVVYKDEDKINFVSLLNL